MAETKAEEKQKSVTATPTNYTTNVPHTAAWLVYLNGVEVPTNAVSVQYGVWQIPTAQVTLPPHVMLQRLGYEDRIMVTIFYLDEFYEPTRPKFCLMGEFELVEWNYTSSGTGRAIQLSCRSPLQIWEQLRFYYMSSFDDIVVGNTSVAQTSGDQIIAPQVLYPYSLFKFGLVPTTPDIEAQKAQGTTTPATQDFEFIKTPSDFIWNLFRGIIGKISEDDIVSKPAGTVPKSSCAVPGRNFFARWVIKNEFHRRWMGLAGIDDAVVNGVKGSFPLLDAVTNETVIKAIQQQLGVSSGSSGSAWEILQKVLGLMLMEIGTTPAPPIGHVDLGSRTYTAAFTEKSKRGGEGEYSTIFTHYIKPQCFFALPPVCNVIFPSMITSYSFSENYLAQPTRIYLGESFLTEILTSNATADISALARNQLTTGYPKVVNDWVKAYILDPKHNTKNFLIYPEEFFKGPVTKHVGAPPWAYLLDQYYSSLMAAQKSDGGGGTSNPKPVGSSSRDQGKLNITTVYSQYAKSLAPLFHLSPAEQFVKLLEATMLVESQGDPNADKGGTGKAKGLGQIMSFVPTMQEIKDMRGRYPKIPVDYIVKRGGDTTEGVYDPELNIMAMCRLLDSAQINADRLFPKKKGKFQIENLMEGVGEGASPTPMNYEQYIAAFYAQPSYAKYIAAQGKKYKDGDILKDPNIKTAQDGFPVNAFREGDPAQLKADFTDSTGKYIEYFRRRCEKVYAAAIEIDKFRGTHAIKVVAVSSPQLAGKDLFSVNTPIPNKAEPAATYATTELYEDPPEMATNEESMSSDATASSAVKATAVGIDFAPAEQPGTVADFALNTLFHLYAKHEYFRSRYEPRGANVNLAFNPYIVPGFPAVIFDSRDTKMDILGYVMSVCHSWNAETPSIDTQVTLGYVRSFPEYLGVYKNGDGDIDLDAFTGFMDPAILAYPRDPITEVARMTQTAAAEQFYTSILYPKDLKTKGIKAKKYFDWRDILDVFRVDTTKGPSKIKDLTTWTWEEGMYVDPQPDFARLFTTYDVAMKYVARPVTTLEEFIQLRSGITAKDLKAKFKTDPKVQTSEDFFLGETRSVGGGAVYYSRIFGLRQGPQTFSDQTLSRLTGMDIGAAKAGMAAVPPAGDDFFTATAPLTMSVPGAPPAATPAPQQSIATSIKAVDLATENYQLADTRRDWDKVILNYRKHVKGKKFLK
jgi:hypothetical protein